ncbi:MAG: hypothetical protein H6Q00_3569 [Holophagaceae bacterium]|nr:hypothetical protein [Holophagaceae bacterium]
MPDGDPAEPRTFNIAGLVGHLVHGARRAGRRGLETDRAPSHRRCPHIAQLDAPHFPSKGDLDQVVALDVHIHALGLQLPLHPHQVRAFLRTAGGEGGLPALDIGKKHLVGAWPHDGLGASLYDIRDHEVGGAVGEDAEVEGSPGCGSLLPGTGHVAARHGHDGELVRDDHIPVPSRGTQPQFLEPLGQRLLHRAPTFPGVHLDALGGDHQHLVPVVAVPAHTQGQPGRARVGFVPPNPDAHITDAVAPDTVGVPTDVLPADFHGVELVAGHEFHEARLAPKIHGLVEVARPGRGGNLGHPHQVTDGGA